MRVSDLLVACPPPPAFSFVRDPGDIEERLLALSRSVAQRRYPLAPLERALAERLTTTSPSTVSAPFHRFLERPASEVVLSGFWEVLGHQGLTDGLADSIVTGLTGVPCERRRGVMASRRDRRGRRTVYAPEDVATGWANRVREVDAANSNCFVGACYAYANVALSHPYTDGNGRLARAMYQRAFARAGLLDAPLIPLGPLIYLNHKIVIAALVRLGTTGDWSPFLEVMVRLTHRALAFTEYHLKSHPQRPSRDIDRS